MVRRSPDCRRHAAGLAALAARREPVPLRDALDDHLGRCDACRVELEGMALAVIAMRRMGELPAAAEGSPVTWPRLRARIERSRAGAAAIAWRWRTTLAGLVAGTLVVAAVVGPFGSHMTSGGSAAEPTGYTEAELGRVYSRIEQRFILDAQVGTFPQQITTPGPQVGIPTRYPDGVIPAGKEVETRPTGRPLSVD